MTNEEMMETVPVGTIWRHKSPFDGNTSFWRVRSYSSQGTYVIIELLFIKVPQIPGVQLGGIASYPLRSFVDAKHGADHWEWISEEYLPMAIQAELDDD